MCYATFRLRSAHVRCATYPRGFGWRAYTLRRVQRFVTGEIRLAEVLVGTARAAPTLPEDSSFGSCTIRGLPKRIVFSVLFYDLFDSWVYVERGPLLVLSSCLSLKWVHSRFSLSWGSKVKLLNLVRGRLNVWLCLSRSHDHRLDTKQTAGCSVV